jgi:hypothetical protein
MAFSCLWKPGADVEVMDIGEPVRAAPKVLPSLSKSSDRDIFFESELFVREDVVIDDFK